MRSRPLWLCDVAAALEAAACNIRTRSITPAATRKLSSWLLTVIGLAGFYGFSAPTPLSHADEPAALGSFGMAGNVSPVAAQGGGPTIQPIHYYMRAIPGRAVDELFHDGFNPIKATFRLGIRPHGLLPLLAG